MTITIAGQSETIERLVALSKLATGAAATKLIGEALSAPSLYVFAELKDCANIKALKDDTMHQSYYHLLEIFSVKTLQDYRDSEKELPPLTEGQLRKLKQLTLVELASKSKLLPYSLLLRQLETNHVRELEDLIIEAIFLGIISGKLNQKAQCLEVQQFMARDILPERYNDLLVSLKKWKYQCDLITTNIEEQKVFLRDNSAKKQKAFDMFTKGLETWHTKLASVKAGKVHPNIVTGINSDKKRPNRD